jgi:hypothetical protein
VKAFSTVFKFLCIFTFFKKYPMIFASPYFEEGIR